jgi:hypothetical protein
MSEIKIGQRWEYKSNSYHFIMETTSCLFEYPSFGCNAVKGVIRQYWSGGYTYRIGTNHEFHPFPSPRWIYLKGQDVPGE